MKWSVDRNRFTLWLDHGLVVGSKTWSETYVSGSSSGGGGFVSGGSGYVNAPNVSVSSTVRTRNTFFLKTADGNERPADINGTLPLRDGQSVSVVYVQRVSAKLGYPLVVYNHTTGQVVVQDEGFQIAAGQVGCALAGFILLLAFFAGGFFGLIVSVVLRLPALRSIMSYVASIGVLYLLWQRSRTFKATRRQLVSEGRQLAEQTAARDAPRLLMADALPVPSR